MSKKTAGFPFEVDEIVLPRDGFVAVIDGAEVHIAAGSRHRSSEKVVHEHPGLFVRDGETLELPAKE